jgi:hypothetical protein
MSQQELERELSRVTGESLGTIRRRGFSLELPLENEDDRMILRMPRIVDWDALEQRRRDF